MQKLQQKQVMKKLSDWRRKQSYIKWRGKTRDKVLQVPSQQKRRNRLKHQRQTINQPKLLRQQQNQLKKQIEDREDVNHLEGATAQASNHETGTNFTADKAIDGDDNTRWATDRDVPKPTFELTLPKLPLSSM